MSRRAPTMTVSAHHITAGDLREDRPPGIRGADQIAHIQPFLRRITMIELEHSHICQTAIGTPLMRQILVEPLSIRRANAQIVTGDTRLVCRRIAPVMRLRASLLALLAIRLQRAALGILSCKL